MCVCVYVKTKSSGLMLATLRTWVFVVVVAVVDALKIMTAPPLVGDYLNCGGVVAFKVALIVSQRQFVTGGNI